MPTALLPSLLLCALLGAPSLRAQDASPAPANSLSAEPALRLPWIYGDGMVLPCGRSLPISGRARPFAEVTVDFGPQRSTVQADEQGRWRVRFMGLGESSEGAVLSVEMVPDARRDPDAPPETLRFEDVVVGEVWLCAGQSNMAFPVQQAIGGAALAQDLAAVPEIRLLDPRPTFDLSARPWTMEAVGALRPDTAFRPTVWSADSPAIAEQFSAVAGAFGRAVHRELRMPLGLVEVAVGGSPTEAWVPRAEIVADSWLARLETQFPRSAVAHSFVRERAARHLEAWLDAGRPGAVPEHPFRPGFLFEATIASLEDFPFAGILWYQGESNADDAVVHDMLFRRAVTAWRESLRNPGLPVLTVQLPGMARSTWPEFRAGQQRLADDLPGVEMAVSIDLGEADDVHPRDKVPVGERLARIALRLYGRPVEDSGPTLRSSRRVGEALELRFHHAEGLHLREGASGAWWVAGEDGRFDRAEARVVDGKLWLTSDRVPAPLAARHAWEGFPTVQLFNAAGLPAAPLRTDEWEPIRVVWLEAPSTAAGSPPPSEQWPLLLDDRLGPRFAVFTASLLAAAEEDSAARRQLLDLRPQVVVFAPECLEPPKDDEDRERLGRATRVLRRNLEAAPRAPTLLDADARPVSDGAATLDTAWRREVVEQLARAIEEAGFPVALPPRSAAR